MGCYANSLGVGILVSFLAGALCGLLFALLTVSLQANQNITGLTLTTFGPVSYTHLTLPTKA